MLSRWEVQLAGPAAAPIPLAAPHAVLSRWLDDPPGRRTPDAAGLSGHADQVRKWAAFAGVGSHTAYGFGVIRPELTWQPPTSRPATQHDR